MLTNHPLLNYSYLPGPDQLRDQRVHVDPEPQHYIGVGTSSPEASSDVLYLWRRCGSIRAPRPRSQWAGEVGWSVSHLFSDQDYIDNRRGYPISVSCSRTPKKILSTHYADMYISACYLLHVIMCIGPYWNAFCRWELSARLLKTATHTISKMRGE